MVIGFSFEIRTAISRTRTCAGFWTRTFFWDGDPCEYMHTALLYVPPAQLTAAVGEVSSLAPPDVQARIAVQNAVLAAFANTSALAFIHGAFAARSTCSVHYCTVQYSTSTVHCTEQNNGIRVAVCTLHCTCIGIL